MTSRLYKKYKEQVIPALQEKFAIKNLMAVPKITKITVNVGINSRISDSSFIDNVESTLLRITGQKPVKTRSKKAISAFKIRENMVVGMKVTLRGQRMFDFLDKLINVSIPRIRDFRGVSPKCIDNKGNLSIGFKEHNVFPEIKSDEIEKVHGLEVCVSTTAQNYAQGMEFFKLMGFVFRNSK